MVNKRGLLIVVGLILFVLIINSKSKPQIIAPECFEKEDCIAPIQEGYCSVIYDCIVGKCYSEQIRCPEICYGDKDEDYDGLIDCKDPDCFNSVYCPCGIMSYTNCVTGRCYCAFGEPRWFVIEDEHWCECV